MGILDTLKDAVTLIQKADNIELNKTILDLQSQVYAQFEENRRLKEKIVTREQLVFRTNAYWTRDANDGPFCSRCWDAEALLIHLHTRRGYYPECPKCKTHAEDPDEPPMNHTGSGGAGGGLGNPHGEV